jgi:hypothetical protein
VTIFLCSEKQTSNRLKQTNKATKNKILQSNKAAIFSFHHFDAVTNNNKRKRPTISTKRQFCLREEISIPIAMMIDWNLPQPSCDRLLAGLLLDGVGLASHQKLDAEGDGVGLFDIGARGLELRQVGERVVADARVVDPLVSALHLNSQITTKTQA